MRIDFSNKDDYWDNVVAAASTKRKSKRSLSDFGGNHKRRLEEEWREDYHGPALSLSPKIEKEFTHDVKGQFIAKIIDDEVTCRTGPAESQAHVLVRALTDVEISTSFGFTLITKLNFDNPGGSLDLSQSYLTFSNNAKITAVFTLEAMIKVSYESGRRRFLHYLSLAQPFRVPGIVTIGPSVRVVVEFNAGLTLSAEIETKIDLADWDVRQTYPAASTEWEPKAEKELDSGETGDKNGLLEPQFYAFVLAVGKAEAHLKTIADFGICFDDSWKVGAPTAGVVADGYVRIEVVAGKSTEASCPWTYGFFYVGAKLYAQIDTPSAFGWGKQTWDLPGSGEVGLPEGGQYPDLRTGQPTKRGLMSIGGSHPVYDSYGYWDIADNATSLHRHGKRVTPWGPPLHNLLQDLLCPSPEGSAANKGSACRELSHVVGSDSVSERAASDMTLHHFEARSVDHKDQDFCDKDGGKMTIRSSNFHTSGTILNIPTPTDTTKFAKEHILEFQIVKNFFNTLVKGSKKIDCYNIEVNINMGKCIQSFWYNARVADRVTVNGVTKDAINWVGSVFPSHENAWGNELVLLDAEVNNLKEGFWGVSVARNADTLDSYTGEGTKAFKYAKDSIAAIRYLADLIFNARLIAQKDRVGNMLNDLETIYLPQITKTIGGRQVTWASLCLQTEWNTYMRTQNALAITKSYALVEKYLAKLVEGYTTATQREAANRRRSMR